MIVDVALYRDGVRAPDKIDLGKHPPADGFVWLGMFEPTHAEFEQAARTFDLHPLAVEDAVHAHQRPKAERYGESWFVVLKTAGYVDTDEVVRLGDVMVFVGENFVATVRHGAASDLHVVRQSLEATPERLKLGPFAVLHALLDYVVDGYATVTEAVNVDIDQIQSQVFSGDRRNHAERIFRLKREVLEFRQAVSPLDGALEQLLNGRALPRAASMVPVDLHEYFRDVVDHVRRVGDRLATQDSLLSDALHANVASVGMRQNEDMRKISAWVAIASFPTMLAGVYGMNFEHMPELRSKVGYPLTIGIMVTVCVLLYRNFKRRGWL